MPAPYTYSFLDVNASLVGPGAGFSIGSGAGVAAEGISIEPNEEIDFMSIGADGSAMHSLNANRSGRVTARMLKTSPVNALLMAAQNFQRSSAQNHGVNTLTITNSVSGDVITCQQVAFAKQPSNSYSKEGPMIEWEFNAGVINMALGAGVQT
jgi:hypothetical protein